MRLRDIAEFCQVGVSTVSRAICDDPRILPETKARILAAARVLGYDPAVHAAARELLLSKVGRRTVNQSVALFYPEEFCKLDYFMHIYKGILDSLIPADFGVLTTYVPYPDEHGHFPPLPRTIRRGGCDGIIAFFKLSSHDAVIANLRQIPGFQQRPIVSLIYTRPDAIVVRSDDRQGTYDAISYLLALGHQEIAYLGLTRDSANGMAIDGFPERVEGVRQAFTERGIDAETHLHFLLTPETWMMPPERYPEREEKAYIASENQRGSDELLTYLTAHAGITALFAFNDSVAIHAWYALHNAGYRVPADISLITFDDATPLLDESGQHSLLTAVHLPLYEIGRAAAQTLLDQIAGNDQAPATITLPPTLIIRQSTAPPRARR